MENDDVQSPFSITINFPENIIFRFNIVLMLGQLSRHWINIKASLV